MSFTGICSACNNSSPAFSEEQAKTLVKSEFEDDGFGKIDIISVTHESGEYIVKWERKSNCESGTIYVSDKSGDITHQEHMIC